MSDMAGLRVIANRDYGVGIPEGVLLDIGQVTLTRYQRYSIYTENRGSGPCTVDIRCDDREIGSFQLGAGQTAKVERSGYDHAFLMFEGGASGRMERLRIQFTPPQGMAQMIEVPLIAIEEKREEIQETMNEEKREVRNEVRNEVIHEEARQPIRASHEGRNEAAQSPARQAIARHRALRQAEPSLWDTGIARGPFIIGLLICAVVAGMISSVANSKSMRMDSGDVAYAMGCSVAFVFVGAVPSLLTGGPGNFLPVIPALMLYALRLRGMRSHWAWIFLLILPFLSLFVTVPCLLRASKAPAPVKGEGDDV